jgi:hypothetical protein
MVQPVGTHLHRPNGAFFSGGLRGEQPGCGEGAELVPGGTIEGMVGRHRAGKAGRVADPNATIRRNVHDSDSFARFAAA